MKLYRKLTISLAMKTNTSIEYFRSLNTHEFFRILDDYNEIIEERNEALKNGR